MWGGLGFLCFLLAVVCEKPDQETNSEEEGDTGHRWAYDKADVGLG